MKAAIVNLSGVSVPRAFLAQWAERVPKLLSEKRLRKRVVGKELSIVFLDLKMMKKTNYHYRGKNRPTDVLSFEIGDERHLGELLISPHIAKIQAKEAGHLYREELGFLILHGALHLLGLDHERGGAEARRFFKIQDETFHLLRTHL